MAMIKYTLSTTGQRASLLSGGDGKASQTITVERDALEFTRLLLRASIGKGGSVSLSIYSTNFDVPQTAASILDALDAADAAEAAENARNAEQIRVNSVNVLAERHTAKNADQVGVDRDGVHVDYGIVASAAHRYETADWPYLANDGVRSSPEAVVWEAELAETRAASFEAALAEARAKLPAIRAAERVAEEAKAKKAADLAAAKIAMGGLESDYRCRIEDGAIQNVPCYDGGKRTKNWLATITVSLSSPGGLSRDFAAKAKGDSYYMVPSLSVGDAVEFGADSYSSSGRKSPERWYGYVLAITDTAILFRPCAGGKSAVKEGAKFAAKQIVS